ncbi:MAG: hypothetical protein AB7P76_08255 [Candidatus Melainabacteria bacterium]
MSTPGRTAHQRLRETVNANHTARLNQQIAAYTPPPSLSAFFQTTQPDIPATLLQQSSDSSSEGPVTRGWSASSLRPASGNTGWIAEDSGALQRNLSRGAQPVSLSRLARREPSASPRRNTLSQFDLPPATYQSRHSEPVDLWQKLRQGHTLSDAETRQLFHTLEVARHAASTREETIQAAAARIHAEQQLARNVVAHAERDAEGNVVLGGVAVRRADALDAAHADIRHFLETGGHLSPEQVLATNKKATWVDIIHDWYFETGSAVRVYDASHPITQALMRDEGVQQARDEWTKKGKPLPFVYNYHFSVGEYARELLEHDGTGSTLGSYTVKITRIPGKHLIQIKVSNPTTWESGTRFPFTSTAKTTPTIQDIVTGTVSKDYSPLPTKDDPLRFLPKAILSDRDRAEPGPGGHFEQIFTWYEKER